MKSRLLLTAALAASFLSAAALAQGPGYGYGPGMMGGGGYGPGMMGGYGPQGQGYGPRGAGLAALNLTDEQRDKILAIQEDNRGKNWGTMGQMRSEMFKLRRMYNSDKVDPNALAEQQKKVDELRRQMLKSQAEARNQMLAVLTPEQKKQWRQFGPRWLDYDDED